MEERRRSTRLGAWLHATYTIPGADVRASNGLVRSTSEGGISLVTERDIAPGAVVRVEIHMPNQRTVSFTTEARWTQPLLLGQEGETRGYETGMAFRDITPEDRKAVMLYTVLSPPTTTA
jgi:hypothetical protein